MNGPQCIECGGFDECNHGMEPPPCCPVCMGDPGNREDHVCASCEAWADKVCADRDEREAVRS
jgi:hypothetical protein